MGHGEEPYHSEMACKHTHKGTCTKAHTCIYARGQFPVYSSLKGSIPISLSQLVFISVLAHRARGHSSLQEATCHCERVVSQTDKVILYLLWHGRLNYGLLLSQSWTISGPSLEDHISTLALWETAERWRRRGGWLLSIFVSSTEILLENDCSSFTCSWPKQQRAIKIKKKAFLNLKLFFPS